VLLPIYLQTLMGYTASLAGLVLAPGGVANLITMPLVGRFLHRYNPKVFVIFGILFTAYSTLLMAGFTLGVDFGTVLWPRIFMGIGMGMLFIPLTTLTIASIKKEDMGNATALYNLVRNIGGSIGIAIVTTMVSRRSQFHQARMVDHLTPYDPMYALRAQQGATLLQQKGIDPSSANHGGLGIMYENMIRQAAMLSFADVFYLLTWMMIILIPLVFFMKNSTSKGKIQPGAD
jgi:DHA2 family multidrug resistance protein